MVGHVQLYEVDKRVVSARYRLEAILRSPIGVSDISYLQSISRRCLRLGASKAAALAMLGIFSLLWVGAAAAAAQPVVVGSKRFTESYILGEIVRQTYVAEGIAAIHKPGLGNTGILEQALEHGAIDLYPEYTGTIVRELLQRSGNPSLDELNRWLAPRGLKTAIPFGFDDTYALAMEASRARQLGISRISDLRRAAASGLRFGLSHEFLERADGWPGLKAAYRLPQRPTGIDHGLAYEAIAAGRLDVIDIYSTDAKIARYHLQVLQDDIGFFPKYEAVLLMRTSLDPAPLQRLSGSIDAAQMIKMNAQVELDGMSFAAVARAFVERQPGGTGSASSAGGANGANGASGALAQQTRLTFWQRLFAPDFGRLAAQHLLLVFGSLFAAIVIAVPLGVAAWRWPRSAGPLLGFVAVLQTVPSLALLAFLIAWLGRIGFWPAVVALFLYALLPIVRNTHAGLRGVPGGLAQAALSLGMTPAQALRHVQLPLATPMLLAGVKTAAVINVGTATMAAFIGAGGFGERIVAGLAINDNAAMLAGALPAAVLALLVQGGFDSVERRLLRGRLESR